MSYLKGYLLFSAVMLSIAGCLFGVGKCADNHISDACSEWQANQKMIRWVFESPTGRLFYAAAYEDCGTPQLNRGRWQFHYNTCECDIYLSDIHPSCVLVGKQ